LIDKIKQWAKTQGAIRALLLTSSRAREDKNVDQLSDYDIENNRQALFNTIKFFRGISIAVAKDLGYKYPDELDRNVSDYIEGIIAKKDV
jgi:hypothetical protein